MQDEYDFSKAKRAKDVPHLAKIQKEGKNKTRITIMLDNDILSYFREKSHEQGIGYQTLINQALRDATQSKPIDEKMLRQIIREEFRATREKGSAST